MRAALLAASALALLAGCDRSKQCAEPGAICTIMGTGDAGLAIPGNLASEEPLYWPSDLTIGPNGDPWVLDWNNHRMITLPATADGEDREVKLVTGNAMVGDGPIATIPASQAHWNHPTNVAFHPGGDGSFVFAAWHNSRVIGVDPALDQTWLVAGTGARGFGGDGGEATLAGFDLPSSVAFGDDGALYVSDQANQRIRRIDQDGTLTTVVGGGEAAFCGDGGPAIEGCLRSARGQDAEPSGRIAIDGDTMYIADTGNNRIRVVDMLTWTISTFAGTGEAAVGAEGGAADAVGFLTPRDLAVADDGSLYVADTGHHCVRRIRDGIVDTVAGSCGTDGFDGDYGPATEALLDKPYGIALDPDGGLWITDTFNHRIRRVMPE